MLRAQCTMSLLAGETNLTLFVTIGQQCIVWPNEETTEVKYNILVNDEQSVEVSRCRADNPRALLAVRSRTVVLPEHSDQQVLVDSSPELSKNSHTSRQTCLTAFTQPRCRAAISDRLCSTHLSSRRRDQQPLATLVTGRRYTRALGKAAVATSTVRTTFSSTFVRLTLSRGHMSVRNVQLRVPSLPSPGSSG